MPEPPPIFSLHACSQARELRVWLRRGEATPEQLVAAFQERHAVTDPIIGATPTVCLERALRQARALDPSSAASSAPPVLWGLPVLVKDTTAVAGVRFTAGSPIFAERVAEVSDPIVLRIESMGGVIVGKTNVPEFAAGSHTFNPLFPATRCPYDTTLSAGGSSGGSAAALAAGQVTLATGSDLGGSLRIPAAFCGVVGLRCTPGRLPDLSSPEPVPASAGPSRRLIAGLYSVSGPMARNVGDLALFMDALAPPPCRDTSCDVYEAPSPHLVALLASPTWQAAADLDNSSPALRVAVTTLGCAVTAEVNEALHGAAQRLAGRLGTGLIDLDVGPHPPFDYSLADSCFRTLRAAMFKQDFADFSPEELAMIKPEIRWNIACAEGLSASELARAQTDAASLATAIDAFFVSSGVDVLVCPATLDTGFPVDIRYPVSGYGTSVEPFHDYLEWMKPAYLLSPSCCPVIALPIARTNTGRPLGVQLMTRQRMEAVLIHAAALLEDASESTRGFRAGAHHVALRTDSGGAEHQGVSGSCDGKQKHSAPGDQDELHKRIQGPRTAEEAAAHHGVAL